MRVIILAAISLFIVGCGEESTSNGNTNTPSNTTVYSGGGDVTINQTTVADNGVYIQNADGTVTYTTGSENSINDDSGDSTAKTPEYGDEPYDPSYNEGECRASGYFWCPLSGSCLDQPATGSACSSAYTLDINMI